MTMLALGQSLFLTARALQRTQGRNATAVFQREERTRVGHQQEAEDAAVAIPTKAGTRPRSIRWHRQQEHHLHMPNALTPVRLAIFDTIDVTMTFALPDVLDPTSQLALICIHASIYANPIVLATKDGWLAWMHAALGDNGGQMIRVTRLGIVAMEAANWRTSRALIFMQADGGGLVQPKPVEDS